MQHRSRLTARSALRRLGVQARLELGQSAAAHSSDPRGAGGTMAEAPFRSGQQGTAQLAAASFGLEAGRKQGEQHVVVRSFEEHSAEIEESAAEAVVGAEAVAVQIRLDA